MDHGKQMVIRLVEMATGGMVLCFCLLLLWGGPGEGLLRRGSRTLLESGGVVSGFDSQRERLEALAGRPAPELRVDACTVSVGETVSIWERIQVQDSEGQWIRFSGQSEITGQILAFYDREGAQISPIRWQEDGDLLEVSSTVGYDSENGRMVFFAGGSYHVALRLKNQYGRRTEAIVTFLVEV